MKKAKPFLPGWFFAWSLVLLLGGLLICTGLVTYDGKAFSVVESLFILFVGAMVLFGMVVLFTGPCSRIMLDPEVCERYNEAKAKRDRLMASYREEISAFRRKELEEINKELEELKSRVDKLKATQDIANIP